MIPIPRLVDRGIFPVRRHGRGSADVVRVPVGLAGSAVLLSAVVVVIIVLDVIVDDHEVNPPVLVPLLLSTAGLLSVDLPSVKGP